MSKGGKVEETASQRAMADIGRQQMEDFKQRWLPVQRKLARDITSAGAEGSFQRRRAATMAGVDTSAQFGQAAEKLDQQAAASGALGTAGHKLGITGMAGDRATSQAMSTVAADQAVTDQYVAGLGAVTALGRGEKATALNGMAQQAAMSGRQAEADAQRSLDNRIGNMQLVGQLAGMAAGQYARRPNTPSLAGNVGPDQFDYNAVGALEAQR